MLQAYATQMALDKLGYENETIDISGFNHEIKKAKILYFAKASLTSDILLSKLGMAKNVLIKIGPKPAVIFFVKVMRLKEKPSEARNLRALYLSTD